MLTYSLNNQPLVLNSGTSFRLSQLNPACITDDIKGDAGIGVDIPVNEHNRAILGNPERFEKHTTVAQQKLSGFEIRFGGVLLLSGSLIIKSANADTYSGWVQSEFAVMKEAVKNKNITEFAWPTAQNFNNKTTYDDDTDHYSAKQVFNRGFWDGIGKEVDNTVTTPEGDREQSISKLQKEHWDNFGYWVNATDTGVGVKITGDGCVVSPYLHLRYVIRESLRLNGFYISRDEFTPSGIGEGLSLQKNMTIYNNFNIMRATYTQVTEILPGWDQNTQSVGDAAYNVITVTSWGIAPFDYKDLLPKISFKDFLLGIQNSLNYIFRPRNNGKIDIIDREAIIPGTAIDINAFRVGFWEMGERLARRIKFNPGFDENDQLFGSKYEDLTNRLADFGEPVATYADLAAIASPAIGELRLVLSENKIYEYKWFVVAAENVDYTEQQVDTFDWEFISTGTQPYIYQPANENEEEIPVNCTTLSRVPVTSPFDTFYYEALQKGNMAQMRSTWSDFAFRLMVGNPVLWANGIDWAGDTGLFATRWKNWARFWATRQEVAAQFQLPLNELLYVSENITSKFRTAEGEFIIEEMETEFSLNNIGVTRIKGYKV